MHSPKEQNRPKDCDCPRDCDYPRNVDNPSCGGHSRDGERPVDGDCPRDCDDLRILTILGMLTVLGIRDYYCSGDGNIPRTYLSTLHNVALPQIMLEQTDRQANKSMYWEACTFKICMGSSCKPFYYSPSFKCIEISIYNIEETEEVLNVVLLSHAYPQCPLCVQFVIHNCHLGIGDSNFWSL